MRTRLPICLLLAALCLLPGENTARGDLIILKDGFVLRGTVRRQSTTTFDPAGGMMEFAKIDGFLWVEDGCRRMIFSHRQVHEEGVEDKDRYRESDQVRLTKPFSRLDNFRLQPGSVPAEITDFDAKWERVFKIDAPTGRISIPQRLVSLSPDFARVESLRYFWAPCYLTSEFSVEKLRKLLSDHPDLKPTGKANENVARRFRAARFFLQAKLYDDAEREYQSLAKDFPDQQEKIEAARDNLRKLRQMQGLDDLERAQKAGRHNWVQEQLAAWPTQGLDERSLGRVQSLKTIYDSTQPNVAQARRYLKELPGRLTSPGTRQLLTEAATAILDELTLENVGRLEAFLNQARLVEKKPTAEGDQGPEALLSLAVTGWLLGNNSAEKKLDTALRLWRARELVLD